MNTDTNRPVGSVDMKRVAARLKPRVRVAAAGVPDVSDQLQPILDKYSTDDFEYKFPKKIQDWLKQNVFVFDFDGGTAQDLAVLAAGGFVGYALNCEDLYGDEAVPFFRRPVAELAKLDQTR